MKRYLIVLDFSTGVATIHNVGVWDAPDMKTAADLALAEWKLSRDAAGKVRVYDMAELSSGWSYYY